jgi:hypothetical protein
VGAGVDIGVFFAATIGLLTAGAIASLPPSAGQAIALAATKARGINAYFMIDSCVFNRRVAD